MNMSKGSIVSWVLIAALVIFIILALTGTIHPSSHGCCTVHV